MVRHSHPLRTFREHPAREQGGGQTRGVDRHAVGVFLYLLALQRRLLARLEVKVEVEHRRTALLLRLGTETIRKWTEVSPLPLGAFAGVVAAPQALPRLQRRASAAISR